MIDPTIIVIKNASMYYYKSTATSGSMAEPPAYRQGQIDPTTAIDQSVVPAVI
jgi:hypothetical protein